MTHRFAVFPVDAVNSVEEANDLVCAMCASTLGEPSPAIRDLVEALPDSGEMLCSVERSADSRGVIIETVRPEDGLLRYLLLETMDRGLAVYDIELFRLYDPSGRVDIDVKLPGDVTLPYVTPALLRDLVLRPTWPDSENPFFIVDRSDQGFIQAYRDGDGLYQLEHRDGGPDAHFEYRTADIGLVADVMWGWVARDSNWRSAVEWTPLEIEDSDDQDSWRPNNSALHIDENSYGELTFEDTDGEPILAYHAGNPKNEKDAEGRLIPIGWVLHLSDEEQMTTGVLDFFDVDEAAAKAKDYLGAPTHNAPRHVSLRNEHREDGSWLNLDASLDNDGTLHINGQDLGPVSQMISPDGEYEYFYTVAPENVRPLVVALGGEPTTDVIDLLTERYCGDASYQLERDIRSSGVEYRFTNYS